MNRVHVLPVNDDPRCVRRGQGVSVTLDMRVACPDVAKHTPEPMGYIAWHEWAEKKARTHVQMQCPTCGLWTIWKRRSKAENSQAKPQP